MENNLENISLTRVSQLLTDIIVNENTFDIKRLMNDDNFRKTGLIISAARGYSLTNAIIEYAEKYGEDTVNYTMRSIMRAYDEKKEREAEQDDSETE